MIKEATIETSKAAKQIGISPARLLQLRSKGDIEGIPAGVGKKPRYYFRVSEVNRIAEMYEAKRRCES